MSQLQGPQSISRRRAGKVHADDTAPSWLFRLPSAKSRRFVSKSSPAISCFALIMTLGVHAAGVLSSEHKKTLHVHECKAESCQVQVHTRSLCTNYTAATPN